MATKNNPGPFDCYANAAPDEPLFVLLSRDPDAAALVKIWAAVRELKQRKPEKIAEARQCAAAMTAWAAQQGHAVTDLPPEMIHEIATMFLLGRDDPQFRPEVYTDTHGVKRAPCRFCGKKIRVVRFEGEGEYRYEQHRDGTQDGESCDGSGELVTAGKKGGQ